MLQEFLTGFVDPLNEDLERARGARWCTTGVVTAYTGGLITATVDGGPVPNIRRVTTSYPTPAVGHVVLLAVVRGTRAVQYVAIGPIG